MALFSLAAVILAIFQIGGIGPWAVTAANGFGPMMSQPGKFQTLQEFWPIFVPSLTAMVGFWATLSLNMPDFTRFGRSQREQVIGQTVALPTTMFVFRGPQAFRPYARLAAGHAAETTVSVRRPPVAVTGESSVSVCSRAGRRTVGSLP